MTTMTADQPATQPRTGLPALNVLLTDAAIGLPEVSAFYAEGQRLVVAGDDVVGMSLAEVALPGSDRIWTNLRRSSELFRLRGAMEAIGPCDRLVLAARDGGLDDGLTLMQTMLAVLPMMRRQGRGQILIVLPPGEGHDAVEAFLDRIGPELRAGGVIARLRTAPVEEFPVSRTRH